jgi:hypothetical protein
MTDPITPETLAAWKADAETFAPEFRQWRDERILALIAHIETLTAQVADEQAHAALVQKVRDLADQWGEKYGEMPYAWAEDALRGLIGKDT